jgi:hypothetical protein
MYIKCIQTFINIILFIGDINYEISGAMKVYRGTPYKTVEYSTVFDNCGVYYK